MEKPQPVKSAAKKPVGKFKLPQKEFKIFDYPRLNPDDYEDEEEYWDAINEILRDNYENQKISLNPLVRSASGSETIIGHRFAKKYTSDNLIIATPKGILSFQTKQEELLNRVERDNERRNSSKTKDVPSVSCPGKMHKVPVWTSEEAGQHPTALTYIQRFCIDGKYYWADTMEKAKEYADQYFGLTTSGGAKRKLTKRKLTKRKLTKRKLTKRNKSYINKKSSKI